MPPSRQLSPDQPHELPWAAEEHTMPGAEIIVMDDGPVIRGLIAKALERKDYVVVEAGADPAQCLLILDLIVPTGMGGKETLMLSRKTSPLVKAIIASGYSDDESLAELVEPGTTEIMAKPYDMQELLSTVAGLIGSPASRGWLRPICA
jgi:DNA-binding NtrC family response regulator